MQERQQLPTAVPPPGVTTLERQNLQQQQPAPSLSSYHCNLHLVCVNYSTQCVHVTTQSVTPSEESVPGQLLHEKQEHAENDCST